MALAPLFSDWATQITFQKISSQTLSKGALASRPTGRIICAFHFHLRHSHSRPSSTLNNNSNTTREMADTTTEEAPVSMMDVDADKEADQPKAQEVAAAADEGGAEKEEKKEEARPAPAAAPPPSAGKKAKKAAAKPAPAAAEAPVLTGKRQRKSVEFFAPDVAPREKKVEKPKEVRQASVWWGIQGTWGTQSTHIGSTHTRSTHTQCVCVCTHIWGGTGILMCNGFAVCHVLCWS